MKKLFLLFVLFFSATVLPAQDKQLGLKGGANFSDVKGRELDKDRHRSKLSWHAGAFLYMPMYSRFFAIQPEIIYSRKGYENYSSPFEIRDNGGNLLYSGQHGGLVRLNYIDMPVMFTFKSGIIIFEIGPQLSVLVGMRDESIVRHTFADGSVVTMPVSRFNREGVSRIDAGFATGFRIQTENGASIGLRFNQGLIKTASNKTNIPQAPAGRNQVFQLFGGYILPF